MRSFSPWSKAMGAIAVSALVACGSGTPETAVPEIPNTEAPAATPASELETGAETTAKAALAPGQYCYETSTDSLDAAVRLTLSADGQVTGDSLATISDEVNSYYTSYRQRLAGNLSETKLALTVTTWIEYDVQTASETWILEGDRLQDGNLTFGKVDCAAVRDRFTGELGVEAADLLSAATNVNTQRVSFAPGSSSAVVSNGVVRGDRDVYLLNAEGGQVMALSITALEDNAAFDVVSPSGEVLVLEGTEEEVFLPHRGDYQVIVGGTRGNASYDLTIAIR